MGKKFKQGSIWIGLVNVVFGFGWLFIIIKYMSWVKEDSMIIYVAFIAIGSILAIQGLILLVRGINDKSVKLHGKKSTGKIIKGWVVTTTQTNNGCTSCYYTYYLEFEYTDQYDNLSTMETTVSKRIYDKMSIGTIVPIIVHKERAVLDTKSL